jgi:hypothetical protein
MPDPSKGLHTALNLEIIAWLLELNLNLFLPIHAINRISPNLFLLSHAITRISPNLQRRILSAGLLKMWRILSNSKRPLEICAAL